MSAPTTKPDSASAAAFDRSRDLDRLIRPSDILQLGSRLSACGFSPAEYVSRHADLRDAGLDEAAGLCQFLSRGFKEKRSVPAGALMQGIDRLLALPVEDKSYLLRLSGAMVVAQLEADPAADVWANYRAVIGKLSASARFRLFLIMGDSHSRLYGHEVTVGDSILIPLNLLCTGGSAIGLSRPDSKSNYGERLLAWAAEARSVGSDRDLPVFVKFGQVDVEFVWTFRRIRQGTIKFSMADFDGFADESVANYGAFLDRLVEFIPARRIKVCSIFPPTLSDAAWNKGYVNAHIGFLEGDRTIEELSEAVRRLEIPGKLLRTELHRAYNSRLLKMSEERGLSFVDDFSPLLDSDGTVSRQFVDNHSGDDHHIHRGGPADSILGSLISRFAGGEVVNA